MCHLWVSNLSRLDSIEGILGCDCGTIYQSSTLPVGHAVQKHLQWEADVRQACLLLMQECNEAHQDWYRASLLPSFSGHRDEEHIVLQLAKSLKDSQTSQSFSDPEAQICASQVCWKHLFCLFWKGCLLSHIQSMLACWKTHTQPFPTFWNPWYWDEPLSSGVTCHFFAYVVNHFIDEFNDLQ